MNEIEEKRIAFADADQALVNRSLQFVAAHAWRITGNDFFDELVSFLGDALGVSYAFCVKIDAADETNVETIALYASGEIVENIKYSLKDTPCANVVGRSVCCYIDKIQERFPDDLLLFDMKAESYAGTPLWSSDGSPLGLIAVIDDKPIQKPDLIKTILQIVAVRAGSELERAQVLEKLKLSEERFREFAELSSDWFWELDENLRYTFISETYEPITRKPVAELIGKTRREMYRGLVANERDSWEDFLQKLERHEDVQEFTYTYVRDDSDAPLILQNTAKAIFDSLGNFRGYRGVGLNVTDRVVAERLLRESEATLRAVFENTPICMNLKDTEGRYLYLNEPYEKWLGHSAAEIIGKKASDFLEGADEINNLTSAEQKVLETGEVNTGEIHIERPDGKVYDRILIKYPVKSDIGETIGLGTVALDITERKQAAEALLLAKKQAEDANKSKSNFLASMSHELRTPLNAVLGYGQMLELDLEKTLTNTQKDYIRNIISSGENVLELITDLLDLARIESDRLSVFIETFSPFLLVQECFDRMTLFAEKRQVTIKLEEVDLGDISVLSDKLRLGQVLINLISNAVKYNKPGGNVKVSYKVLADEFLRIQIADNGIGIAKSNFNKLFELFQRANENPLHAVEGTGIGLFVSKKLIDRLGARIGFESQEGVGSTFWVDVPIASNNSVMIWTDDLRVGVDAIDKDHQVVFSLINEVSKETVENEELASVIQEMIDYTSYHFRREEAIMEVCGYPELAEHKEYHQKLERHIWELAADWEAQNDIEILYRLKSFLRNWWSSHILDVDTTIGKYAKGYEAEIHEKIYKMSVTSMHRF